ncbi:hypothetical protein MRB53_025178 [Persea americana]|uniref:Uncharacterized protein n=1 Tax=Persea americana TaxID=3435 RepID=A0ACC2LET9_PERAE|nr:hypothetical protein MRB53_025178 [Persea americana]
MCVQVVEKRKGVYLASGDEGGGDGAALLLRVGLAEHTKVLLSVLWIIVKEKGIFANVTSPTSKAKLRLLFEVAPLGFLVENAGGYTASAAMAHNLC